MFSILFEVWQGLSTLFCSTGDVNKLSNEKGTSLAFVSLYATRQSRRQRLSHADYAVIMTLQWDGISLTFYITEANHRTIV